MGAEALEGGSDATDQALELIHLGGEALDHGCGIEDPHIQVDVPVSELLGEEVEFLSGDGSSSSSSSSLRDGFLSRDGRGNNLRDGFLSGDGGSRSSLRERRKLIERDITETTKNETTATGDRVGGYISEHALIIYPRLFPQGLDSLPTYGFKFGAKCGNLSE